MLFHRKIHKIPVHTHRCTGQQIGHPRRHLGEIQPFFSGGHRVDAQKSSPGIGDIARAGVKMHAAVRGYAPQKPDRLEGLCIKCCEIRKQCAKEMVEKVMKLYPITPESVMKYATGSKSIFKQHILHALIDYGYTTEFYGELNDELFNMKTGTCLVEREYPDVNFVLDLIHSSRGIAVMAHPVLYDSFELMDELAAKGKLDGVEVYHYTADENARKQILETASKYDLIVTGGSDFHGLYNAQPTHIGSETTDKENIDRIYKLIKQNKNS